MKIACYINYAAIKLLIYQENLCITLGTEIRCGNIYGHEMGD